MFSNQSVAGQPSPAGIAVAVVPESDSGRDTLTNSSHVLGGSTPASAKGSVRYHTVDLLATLKKKPYSCPSKVPRFCHASVKFARTAAATSPVSGLIWPFLAYSAATPICGISATSGG